MLKQSKKYLFIQSTTLRTYWDTWKETLRSLNLDITEPTQNEHLCSLAKCFLIGITQNTFLWKANGIWQKRFSYNNNFILFQKKNDPIKRILPRRIVKENLKSRGVYRNGWYYNSVPFAAASRAQIRACMETF